MYHPERSEGPVYRRNRHAFSEPPYHLILHFVQDDISGRVAGAQPLTGFGASTISPKINTSSHVWEEGLGVKSVGSHPTRY